MWSKVNSKYYQFFSISDRIKDQHDSRFRQLEDRLKSLEKSSGRLEKKTDKIEDTQDVRFKVIKVKPTNYQTFL